MKIINDFKRNQYTPSVKNLDKMDQNQLKEAEIFKQKILKNIKKFESQKYLERINT